MATAVRLHNAFTPGQLETFLAIADTIIPSLTDNQLAEFKSILSKDIVLSNEDEWAPLLHFAKTSASESPEFLQGIKCMESNLNMAQFKAIAGLMDLLRSRVGSLMLCRSWTPFHLLSPADRTAVIQMWRTSSSSLYAKLYRGTAGLARYCFSQTSLIYEGLGFPATDPDIDSDRYHNRKDSFHQYAFEDLASPNANLNTDVLIVGTGAGGGVVAKNIVEWSEREGKRLNFLVVEQGEYVPHEDLKMTESESVNRMWEKGIMTTNTEGTLGIGFGRTFGGGTAINWSVSLRTPGLVRREWAEDAGVDWYMSKEFHDSLVRVEERMGVSKKHLEHNMVNRLMLNACDTLGYKIEETPVNTGGYKHSCSYCGHGCRYGEKMGTMNTWLVDASKAGCRFAEQVSVRKILFEDIGKGKKKVIGVECLVGDERTEGERKKITIKCKKVIVSGGALHSPALLLRSNLKNPQIGSNLRIHPVTFHYGFFPPTHPSTPINPHLGPVISTVITETANLGASPYTHYGSRIEAGYMFPIVGLSQLPWLGGLEFKRYLAKHRNMMAIFSLARDGRPKVPTEEDPNPPPPVLGKVTLDKFSGDPIFSYVALKEDKDSIVEGLVVAAEVLRTAGATEILSGVRSLNPYILQLEEGSEDKGVCEPGFKAWISQLRKLGGQVDQLYMSSAHQLGSCRMGPIAWENADADGKGWHEGMNGRKWWDRGGVVDPEGRVYGVEGLYVCDGSVLPGATGVNPMLTIMGVADLLSRRMAARWDREGFAGRKVEE